MLFAIAVGACLLAAEPAPKSPEQQRIEAGRDLEKQRFEAERMKREELREKLAEKSIWTDPKQRDTLLSYLNLARRIRARWPNERDVSHDPRAPFDGISYRPESLVKLLLPHLAYSPNPPKKDAGKPPDLDKQYPVAGTLVALGTVAVPELLDLLKSANPAVRTGGEKRRLALYCLLGIYGEGGYGPQMVRERIELEIKNTPVKDRGFLAKALESPLLKKPPSK